MAENYCPSCGSELADDAGFCSECGTEIGGSNGSPGPTGSESERADTVDGEPSDTMFRVTSGLVVGYFVLVLLGAGISSNAVIGLGALCLLVSLVTMYVDLRDLDEPLWGTRPILWAVGAALLYIVVAPLYVYKRRQVA